MSLLGIAHVMKSRRYRWAAVSITIGGLLLVLLHYRYYSDFPHTLPWRQQSASPAEVDWSRFAYTQYVTNSDYLCNSVMFFALLQKYHSKADRVIMYPSNMMDSKNSGDAKLLTKAKNEYDVKLVPITIQRRGSAEATWAESYTKLLAFNQTQYDRVLSIDSDSLLLQHMDELFLLPSCVIAMPRAYWLFPENPILSSQLMLIQPSDFEFARISDKIDRAGVNDYDMEIVNDLYHDSAMVLPHRPYDMVTGEFRSDKHDNYLGNNGEQWNPAYIYNEAKLAHFSDWPVPKPWLPMSDSTRQKYQPACHDRGNGSTDCVARDIWNGFYQDFASLRKKVCRGSQRHSRHIV